MISWLHEPANLLATYHGGRHEEVPREEGSQTHNEEDDPHRVVPAETKKGRSGKLPDQNSGTVIRLTSGFLHLP